MATQTKRAWKLQEFVAHSSNVNCLALGPTSGRVMVTGGEDRKVNMWAIGKPNVILSLSGHTSPVESVRFNTGEDQVLAGSQSGTLKIWDLEAAKIVRTLTGHKSSIQSLDFHPYGDFVGSGSLDTNLKLWDVRRKGCIFTYKGHTDGIKHIQFSPDGRWVVSAGEDSTVKLWDLTAGKLINDFKLHTGPVNCAEFHPKEFLLATGSSDRTIKFWDLETFQLVSSSDGESSAVRCISFHPDGICLFSGSQDSLKIFAWEPVRCYESVSVSWGRVASIAQSSSQLIGASYSQTNVSVWVVDVAHVENLIAKFNCDEPYEVGKSVTVDSVTKVTTPTQDAQTPVHLPSSKTPPRKAFNTDRPITASSKSRSSKPNEKQKEFAEEPLSPQEKKSSDMEPADEEEIFTPKSKIERTPPRNKPEPFPAPLDDKPAKEIACTEPKAIEHDVKQPQVLPNVVSPAQPSKIIPSERDKPAGLQMSDFLPRQKPVVQEPVYDSNFPPPQPQISEAEAISLLSKSHTSIVAIMTLRQRNLSAVARCWGDGEIKAAVQTAVDLNDQAILVDLLNVLSLKQSLWNLNICSLLLPQLRDLLCSKYESHVQTGANAVKLILRNFAPVIKSNMAAPPCSVGVDLVREERYKKCEMCHSQLLAIRSVIVSKTNMTGKMGSLFRELSLAFTPLD